MLFADNLGAFKGVLRQEKDQVKAPNSNIQAPEKHQAQNFK
jgi:hypothetical protein